MNSTVSVALINISTLGLLNSSISSNCSEINDFNVFPSNIEVTVINGASNRTTSDTSYNLTWSQYLSTTVFIKTLNKLESTINGESSDLSKSYQLNEVSLQRAFLNICRNNINDIFKSLTNFRNILINTSRLRMALASELLRHKMGEEEKEIFDLCLEYVRKSDLRLFVIIKELKIMKKAIQSGDKFCGAEIYKSQISLILSLYEEIIEECKSRLALLVSLYKFNKSTKNSAKSLKHSPKV